MSTEFIILLVQAGIAVGLGVMAIYSRRRLTQEMVVKFKNAYGKTEGMKKFFDSRLINLYLEFGFLLFGVCAFIFAFFRIFGPINNW